MKIKKFKDIYENILDDEDEIENKWEVRINDATDSFWEYKNDAIDRIVEILDSEGENPLEGYEYDDNEMSISDISYLLFEMDESEFYDKLDELKNFVDYDGDIKLINIADEDEIEFLDEN